MNRGKLTPELSKLAAELLGIQIDTKALRLLPYLDNSFKNFGISANKLNDVERDWIGKFLDCGLLEGTVVNPVMTKKFYDAMQELLWHSYVSDKAEVS